MDAREGLGNALFQAEYFALLFSGTCTDSRIRKICILWKYLHVRYVMSKPYMSTHTVLKRLCRLGDRAGVPVCNSTTSLVASFPRIGGHIASSGSGKYKYNSNDFCSQLFFRISFCCLLQWTRQWSCGIFLERSACVASNIQNLSHQLHFIHGWVCLLNIHTYVTKCVSSYLWIVLFQRPQWPSNWLRHCNLQVLTELLLDVCG